MTEYEVIDALCDSVNPTLFIMAIGVGIAAMTKKDYKKARVVFGLLIIGLLLVYVTLFVDTKLKIWQSFGGDYSTHTAFAIAACIAISAGRQWTQWLIGVFFLYVAAMLYQQYHSVLDIVTTTMVIGGPLFLIRIKCDAFLVSGIANVDSDVI
jgi:hypothetical protein